MRSDARRWIGLLAELFGTIVFEAVPVLFSGELVEGQLVWRIVLLTECAEASV